MNTGPTATPGWPEDQPLGEDYFLLQMTIDTPSDPRWDEGASALGSWQQIKNAYAAMVAVATPLRRQLTFKIYQGADVGRERLAFSLGEEIRYQREKKTTPNN